MRRRLTELLWSMFLRAKFLAFCFLRGGLIESFDATDVANARVEYCLIHQLVLDHNFILLSCYLVDLSRAQRSHLRHLMLKQCRVPLLEIEMRGEKRRRGQ